MADGMLIYIRFSRVNSPPLLALLVSKSLIMSKSCVANITLLFKGSGKTSIISLMEKFVYIAQV